MKRGIISSAIGVLALSLLALSAWPDNELEGIWTGHITDPSGGRHDIVLET
jgi:hypothetical protein